MKSRKKFLCMDCQVDTGKIHEHYFVNTELWLKAAGSKNGMLCVKHLEFRIGRELRASDFTKCTINNPKYEPKSQRLMLRMQN